MGESGFQQSDLWRDPDPDGERGLLLSDRIQYYVNKIRLIEPFDRKFLHAASYTLRAGNEYWLEDKPYSPNERNQIVVPKNGLIYIRIWERLNLPYYMIAQHDLKVKQVYRGFLAGRSALIDPGYSGHIYYPIFNFTNQDKTIEALEEIITICFIKTTSFGTVDFCKQNRTNWSPHSLREAGSVSGLENNKCIVEFPVPERPIGQYWVKQDTHISSVAELRQDVTRFRCDLDKATNEMESKVAEEIRDLRKFGWISGIVCVLAFLSIIVATWAGIYRHFCWTRDTVNDLQKEMRGTPVTTVSPGDGSFISPESPTGGTSQTTEQVQ